jgi:hypothetical protein
MVIDMPYGHGRAALTWTWTCCMSMGTQHLQYKRGHESCPWSRSMDMDMQHVPRLAVWTWTWSRSMDM